MITNKLGLPAPFVAAASGDYRYKPDRYSVTDVLGGTCEAILKRRHQGEVTEDVADRVWAIFGTAVHKLLEGSKAKDGQMQEKWLCVPDICGKYELSGIFDLYDEATGTVTDWKVTSVWTVQLGDFEKWRSQTLLYCWMLRQSGYDAKRGEIVAILRDHNMRKARNETDYPESPVFKISWDFSDEEIAEAGEEAARWIARASKQEKLPDSELEPCSAGQRWRKPDKWAVMKDGRKRAVRVFEDEAEAVALLNELKEADKGHHMEFRPGEDTKCDMYCPVAEFCPHTASGGA